MLSTKLEWEVNEIIIYWKALVASALAFIKDRDEREEHASLTKASAPAVRIGKR